MVKEIDWEKPIKTTDGRKARLLEVLNGTDYIVAVTENDEYEAVQVYTKDDPEIYNPPREYWVNIYGGSDYIITGLIQYPTREEAKAGSGSGNNCLGQVLLYVEKQ